ncbi:serine/threonine protein kinase [Microcoleus vaginatus PCC 9802]|uniref:serine/threonine protein kinase n=1 Tax=Microcoleus vaginatus TaxID=119532 RepID=UPI00020D19A8|nr:serine/threonine protein kinase [Microcoleus vaginatus FGP-2]UNU19586.1 serine/threonine protein kinase [Microcoleus vaginatus PCC 9802]
MNAFPDFSQHGYQISSELGYNSLGGRVTYLATKIHTKKSVVIKQFQFAQLGASWTEYEAYEQEIKVLQNLDLPGIPRYLDSFQTDSGFCMVQEYKNAESAVARTFSPPDIKQIAIATLEILVYLQAQKPPIIHRDIKPENLLIDQQLNVYLVDFGFARLGGGNIAASSVVKGTMGFMPPEQMFNRKLTKASDLYGLGATLICLLSGTQSGEIGNLIDDNYSIHFRHLVPPLQRGWMNWLETMVAPRLQDRYPSAADALTALESLDVSRLPKVRIERDRIQFAAAEYGDKVTQIVTVSNPIPDTILAGRWEVAPHPNDPPHTPYDHPCISFEPQKFEGNEVRCKITVDTSKLLANKIYHRQMILHVNSDPDTHKIEVEVKTAPLPEPKQMPYLFKDKGSFMLVFICVGWLLSNPMDPQMFFALIAVLLPGFAAAEKTLYTEKEKTLYTKVNKTVNWFESILGATLGITAIFLAATTFSSLVGSGFGNSTGKEIALLFCLVISAIVGASGGVEKSRSLTILTFVACGLLIVFYLPSSIALIFVLLVTNLGCFKVVYTLAKARSYEQIKIGFFKKDAVAIAFLTAGFYISLGAVFQRYLRLANEMGSIEPLKVLVLAASATAPLLVTAIPLIYLIVLKRNRMIAGYRKSKPYLIKP